MTDYLEQIDALLDSHEIKKAEVLIAKHLRADSTTEIRAELLLRRARARLAGQYPDGALEDMQTARALDRALSSRPDVLELIADIYFARFELAPVGFVERSNADRALTLYQQIIEGYPNYDNLGWVIYQKGRVLLTSNATDDAISCFQEAFLKPCRLAFLTAFCYERLGFVYLFDRRDPTAALTFLDRASVTYPPSESEEWLGQLHILRSRALREQGKLSEALTAANKAAQIMERMGPEMRSGLQDAHLAIGEILARMPGRETEAVNHLQQFQQLGKKPLGVDVTWSRVNELLGDMSFKIGNYEAAIDAYSNSLAFNPYHPWQAMLYYQIARCHYRLRAYEKTVSTVGQMEQAARDENQEITDYHVFHLLGNAYFALEQFDSAVDAYQQAVQLAPTQADDLDKIRTYLRFAQELSVNH